MLCFDKLLIIDLLNRHSLTQIVYFFLCDHQQIVCFKEWVHFISIIKFVDTGLFVMFLYCPFMVYRISSDGQFLISGISGFCLLFFLVNLVRSLSFIDFFKEVVFGFFDFLISSFQLHYFLSFIIFLLRFTLLFS